MLLGIIKDTTNNIEYYINQEEKDNYSEITFVKVEEGTTKALTKEEIRKLLKTILSSNLTYKEKYNDYDVYLDEANNKRYFKNGTENLFMFLENNGVSAINCLEKISKKGKSKRYNIIVSAIVFDMILSSATLIPFAGDIQIRENIDKTVSSIMPITTNELVDSIQQSKYLTDDEKEFLHNEDYFNFVLENSDEIRNYSIRKAFNEVNIETFTSVEVPNADGYFDPLHPNTIYILESNMNEESNSDELIIHEFIHMTQSNSCPAYIKEACDEMFKSEFYGKPNIAYKECVKRTKVLMEIVGPGPIIDANFKSNSKNFEEALKKYLTPEEAEELLKLLNTSSVAIVDPSTDMNAINASIDQYLSKMYYNKTGNDIENDQMIRQIYTNGAPLRFYFNYNSSTYHKDIMLNSERVVIETFDMSEIETKGEIESYSYYPNDEKSTDGSFVPSMGTTDDFSKIPLDQVTEIRIFYKDGTQGYTRVLNQETGEWKQVERAEFVRTYEPSIDKKFPEQVNYTIKYKPTYEKEQSEAKLI